MNHGHGACTADPVDAARANSAAEVSTEYDYDYAIQLGEWLKREGLTYRAALMEGRLPNHFTINGKAYPRQAEL